MADEDKKPRHRLGADELLEETHGAVGKIVSLLESNGLAAESVDHISSLAKALDFMVSWIETFNLPTLVGRQRIECTLVGSTGDPLGIQLRTTWYSWP